MFNKTFISLPSKRTTTYVDRHVTINNAPTDESVSLLKEMEEKAEAKFIASFPIGDNNSFSGRIFILRDFSMFDVYSARVVFTLNGRDFRVDVTADSRSTTQQFIDKIKNAVASEVSRSVLEDIFNTIDQDSLFNLKGMDL